MMITGAVFFLIGCQTPERSTEEPEKKQTHYEIGGFYIFPLKDVLVGQTPEEVATTLGKPPLILKSDFQEPSRVKLASLPEFDEQWGYGEGLASNWVFFHDSKVVAAFREESDW